MIDDLIERVARLLAILDGYVADAPYQPDPKDRLNSGITVVWQAYREQAKALLFLIHAGDRLPNDQVVVPVEFVERVAAIGLGSGKSQLSNWAQAILDASVLAGDFYELTGKAYTAIDEYRLCHDDGGHSDA
jgi:hypothetical protein